MAVGTGFGFDVSALQKALDALDKNLEKAIKKGEDANKAFAAMFKGKEGIAFNKQLMDIKKNLELISKEKDPLKWNSKDLGAYVDQINRMVHTVEKMNNLAGTKGYKRIVPIDISELQAIQKELLGTDREVTKLEQKAEKQRTARNQTYSGALKYSDKANTLEKERQAIENLKVARDKLKQSDADYANKLNRLNEAILKHEKHLRDATKTNNQKAEEDAKVAQRQLREEQRLYEERARLRREENKKKNQTYEGAIAFSSTAKTLNREIQAVKNLEAARAKLSKADADYARKLDNLNTRIRQHNQNIERATSATKEHNNALSAVGRGIAAAFSVQALRGYVNQMIKVRGEMELQQRSLQAILQNKDAANEIWQKTIDLAVRSPFRIKDLVTYTKQLAAYRIEADKLYETNKMLADVSAGLGVDMQRLILAFGQVKAANFLRGTELRQFTEAGIPMLDELAKHFNDMNNTALTSADVFEMISKRMVLFEDVEAVFERLTKAGGTFYRMQEIQAETLRGQISNLKDSIDIMLNDIGKANDGTMKFAVKSVKMLVDNYERLVPILKTVISAMAVYKLNAFLAARNTGILTSMLFNMGVATEKFFLTISKNPWTAITAVILAAVGAVYRYVKALNDVDKAYSDMSKQQSEITSKFFKAKDIDERKRALKDLIEYANKEYSITVNLDLKGMSDDEVRTEMNRLRQQMIKANAFGSTFQKELIKANQETSLGQWWDLINPLIGQGMNKDIDQMGDSYENLNRILVNNLAPTIDYLSTQFGKLNKDQRDALESLKAGIGEWSNDDEDMVDYFERIRGNYETLIGLLSKSDNIADKKIARQLKKYQRRFDEAEKEFQTFVNRIDDDIAKLNAEDKAIFLSAAIDDAKSEKNWSEFEETQIRKWLEKKYEIELTPKIVEEDKELEAWQDSYNDLFVGKEGWRKIRTKGTSQTQVIEQLNAQYKATEELVKRIQQAGEDSILEGGAYEGENLEKLKKVLADIREQLDWFGAEEKKDNNKESDSIKILQKRINLLKEVNKKYLELEKTFDAATAKEKVMEAYADTFKEAFEGTGVDLNLYQVMTQAIVDAHQVGEDAGSALTEGMLAKMKELEASGTYIRAFSDSLVEQIKKHEGFRATAYQDAGGVWTQGYGETQGVERDKAWTKEYAEQRLRVRLANDYAAAVNKVLDANRDLIVTQEQYNALVDLAYQGGGGAVKNLVKYAKDIEQGTIYIERISQKIKTTMGEEAAARFGDTFVNSFREAETIQERMAMLLQTMNLTIKGKINKDWYAGMQKRSDQRASMFSGDLDVAKQLETVLVKIAGMDFTTTEGMVEALGKLKEIAEKEGPEAKNILSQAISGLEAEIGVRLKKDADKKLNDEVQALFDRYELTVDLKKLNLPKDLAEQLFDVKYLDLEGLRKAVQDKASEFVGTDQYEKYKEFLEKIDEMERKSIIERTKKYSEYLKEGMNKRVELKVEELRKLKELEESKEFEPKQKEQIRKQIRLDTQKQLDKESWDQFQATDWYTMMFTDLETLGTQAIKNLRDELSALKDSLAHLDPSEVKEIVSQMEKLQEQLIARNPFEAFRDARKDIKALGATEEDVIGQLKAYEDNERNAQKMLDMLSEIENARATGSLGQLSGETLTYFRSLRDEVLSGNKEAFNDARKTYEHILSEAQAGKKLTSEQVKMFQDYRKSLQGIADYWGEIDGKVQSIVGSAINIMDVYGVDEATKSIAEGVGNMSTLITQAVQFGIQMKVAGVAANNALGIIGWAAIAIQAIATIISSIANYKNAQIDKQLEEQAKKIEEQRDLYEQIEKKVESAYNVDQLRQYNNEMARSVELEIQALEASIALEKSRKNVDEEQVKDYENQIAESRERLTESTQEMREMVGGIFDLEDFTSGFVDAWWDAMEEGMDGIDALNDHFEDTMKDLVKKQALYKGAQKIMEQVTNAINADLEGDFDIDDWAEIERIANKANVDLDAFLQGYRDIFNSISDGAGGSLSALQKGIQGITEDTAQIIEAYLNSIRGYVSEQVTHTKNIYNLLRNVSSRDGVTALQVRMIS